MQWDELHWKTPGDKVPYQTDNPWFYRPYDIPDIGRTVWVMGWNYERGEGEMLESYCHRIESVLSRPGRRAPATVVGPGGVLADGTSRLSAGGRRLFHYLGVSSFAEYAVVPASGAIRIRSDAPLDVVALVGCAVATGVGAVANTAAVEAGATVVVIGCGGVGLSVVQGAKLAGAVRIVAVDVRSEKTALAARLGATDQVDAAAADPVSEVRDLLPDGADYAFDAIGLTSTTEQAIRMLGLGGAAVIVGLPPAGARASFEPLVLAESDQRILGCNYGSVRPAVDIPVLVDRFMTGDLLLNELISTRQPLEAAGQALDALAAGRVLRTLPIP
jgi:S-(hydroxymethyl)glutathione dehydrogenase/alcohol dehydrogenase